MIRIAALMIAAVMSAPEIVPAPGSSKTYRYALTGRFWNGALVQIDRIDTLKSSPGVLELSKVDSASAKTTTSQGTVGADGTVSLAEKNAASDPFAPYNTIALLLRGAQSYSPGARWEASVFVQTGQTIADLTRVPLSATVASTDGNAFTVQGIGKTSAVSAYGEYHDPIDLTIQIAARFQDGELQRADYKATEFVHAGPLSQTMTWSWSLALESVPAG